MTRLRRVSPIQTTKDSIIVPHNTKGQPVDPNTWEPLVKGQIDVGHNYQFEERVMRKAAERVNMSQADYSKMMNDPKLYRLETRRNNRSHKFECPNYSEQVHAAFKTIRQFYNKQRSAQREAVVEARLKAKYGNKPHYKSTVQHTDGKHAIIGYSTGHPAHRSAQGSRSLSDIAASHKSAAAAHSKSSAASLAVTDANHIFQGAFMENLRVLSGSVAVLNDIPARYLHPGDSPAQSRDYLLPGYFHDQYISLHLPENSLTTGTLFLGQPRCGKTNTIFLLAPYGPG